jgi:hypothetical protein
MVSLQLSGDAKCLPSPDQADEPIRDRSMDELIAFMLVETHSIT